MRQNYSLALPCLQTASSRRTWPQILQAAAIVPAVPLAVCPVCRLLLLSPSLSLSVTEYRTTPHLHHHQAPPLPATCLSCTSDAAMMSPGRPAAASLHPLFRGGGVCVCVRL